MLRLILGGAALQRRGNRAVLNAAVILLALLFSTYASADSGADTNHPDTFRQNTAAFSQFARDAVYPYGAGGPNASFAMLTANYMRRHGAHRLSTCRP